LSWSLLQELEEVVVWTFLGGLILDILTTTPFGVFTTSLLVMSVLANFWQGRLSRNAFVLPILLALPYTMGFNLCGLILMRLAGYTIPWGSALGRIVFPAGLMNVVTMALVFPLLFWLSRLTQEEGLTI
jgi:rod shape-determining protein MreD